MAPQSSFPVFDVDSHVYEPVDIWTQYLEPEYRVLARSAFWHEVDENGLEMTILNGQSARPMNASRINRQAIYRPGMSVAEIGSLDPQQPHPVTPGANDSQARLADMDAMGIDQALLMPTLFSEYFPVVESVDVASALARAYNDWILDFAKAAPERLIPAAILPMQSPLFALRELQRVAKLGFKAVAIRPAFHAGRMPNAPEYDPLWAALEASNVAACMLPSPGGTNPEWTSEGAFVERVASHLAIGHRISESVAPWMDNGLFLSAICFFGHMETYPKLKLSYHHSGAHWVPLILEKSETYLWLQPQMGKPVSLDPGDIFFNRPSLVNFDSWESCVHRLPDIYETIGAWGSRYPQHDASDAREAIQNLEQGGLSGDRIRNLMGGNAARFYGIEAAAKPVK